MPESEGGFKEFEIRDIFEVKSPSKRFNANAIKLGKGYPYVVRTSENNGIKGYTIQDEKYLCEGGTISFGQDTATIFFQEKPYFTGDKIKVMKCRDTELNTQTASYMLTALRKSFSSFSWGVSSFNEAVLNSVKIILPVKTNGNVDYQYMQHVIECIENDICLNVDKFLESNGYSDCTLTAEERQALIEMESGDVQMMDRTIKEIFSVVKGKRLTKDNMIPGTTNFIGASATENGITNHISNNEHIHSDNKITVTYNGSVGESFYQPFPFWASDDVNVLYPNEELSESQCLYFLAPLRKKGKRYGYAFKWAKEIMEQDTICVPVRADGSIDYSFMDTYVNALKKQCIARLKASLKPQQAMAAEDRC